MSGNGTKRRMAMEDKQVNESYVMRKHDRRFAKLTIDSTHKKNYGLRMNWVDKKEDATNFINKREAE
jgi:hypothetical protein